MREGRGAARGGLRLPRPRREVEVVTIRARPQCPARSSPSTRARGPGLWRSRRGRSVFDGAEHEAGWSPASPSPGSGRRAGDLRAAQGDARRAARWAGAVDERGRSCDGARGMSARPDRPAGRHRRAARRLRGDGRRARAQRALGEHQGAPRLLDRRCSTRRRDGHAGRAHPGPPRRDAGRGRRRARRGPRRRAGRGSSTTRSRGGTHLPDITVITPVFARTAAGCSASPPAAPTTPTSAAAPRLDAGRLDDARRGGRRDRAARARRRGDRRARAQMRQPAQRRADLRAQLAANRIGARRLRELAARLGGDALRRGDRRRARLRRAPHARLPRGPARRAARGARRAGGARGRPRAAARRRPSRATG